MKAILLSLIALFGLTTVATADPVEGSASRRLMRLAHELEDAARNVHHAAEAGARYRSGRASWVLIALHDLDRKARHYHRQVERRRSDPRHTADDFYDLWASYRRAEQALRHGHGYRHVYADFRRVTRLMNELDRFYGGYGRPHGRNDGHGPATRRHRSGGAGPWGYDDRW